MPVTREETVVHSTPLIFRLDSEVHKVAMGLPGYRFPSGPQEAEGSGDGPTLSPGSILHVSMCGGYPCVCFHGSLLELVGADGPGQQSW